MREIQILDMVKWLKYYCPNHTMTDAQYKSVARHILNMPTEARKHFMVTLSNTSEAAGHQELSGTYGVFQTDTKYTQYLDNKTKIWVVIKRDGNKILIRDCDYTVHVKTVCVCDETNTEYIEFKTGRLSAEHIKITVWGIWE
jgi:hypothetical protein